MHHIYHTKGFIIGGSAVGEANRLIRVFTKEMGLIRASATGVRHLKSKLRYSLQDFCFSEISLVRGKDIWRITGARKEIDIFDATRTTPLIRAVFGRVFALLDRLLSGEEKNELLFTYLEEAVRFGTQTTCTTEEIRHFEYIVVLRVLFSLGYLGASADCLAFTTSPYFDHALLRAMPPVSATVLGEINRSLRETQL